MSTYSVPGTGRAYKEIFGIPTVLREPAFPGVRVPEMGTEDDI